MKPIFTLLSLLFSSFAVLANDMNAVALSFEKHFNDYIDSLNKYDIILEKADGFEVLDTRGRESATTARFRPPLYVKQYPYVLENADAGVAFLYPEINLDEKGLKEGFYVENEIRSNEKNIDFDVRQSISILSRKEAEQYSNADTAVVYELDMFYNDVPYLGVYRHCVGIYLRKYAHPAMLLKVMLSDSAYTEKDKYVRMMLDLLRYGNEQNPEMEKFEHKVSAVVDLDFPSKKKKFCGFIMDDIDDETLDAYVQFKKLRDSYRAKMVEKTDTLSTTEERD